MGDKEVNVPRSIGSAVPTERIEVQKPEEISQLSTDSVERTPRDSAESVLDGDPFGRTDTMLPRDLDPTDREGQSARSGKAAALRDLAKYGLDLDDSLADRIVSEAFPVSPSIQNERRRCRREATGLTREYCDDTYRTLIAMGEERRDTKWAEETERELKRVIAGRSAEMFEVRRIVCRSTICAFEVTSYVGPFFGLKFNEARELSLLNGYTDIAYERDSVGVRVTVTLVTVVRR